MVWREMKMSKVVYLITKNKGKIMAAQAAFALYDIEIRMLDKDYPEIQADSSLEIAKHTAMQAAKETNLPVIREDHSLFFHALGFPGPYTSFIEKRMSAQKLIEILKQDNKGYFEIATVYAEPNGFTKECVFRVPIKVSPVLKGEHGNWDRVLMLEGQDKTFAESTEEENVNVWNKNYLEIAQHLSKK
jgi:XTP/dITP diphosphohydrolase